MSITPLAARSGLIIIYHRKVTFYRALFDEVKPGRKIMVVLDSHWDHYDQSPCVMH